MALNHVCLCAILPVHFPVHLWVLGRMPESEPLVRELVQAHLNPSYKVLASSAQRRGSGPP